MNLLIDTLLEILAFNIWQLSFILIALIILKRIKDDIRPIFIGMVTPLTKQAQTNAVAWAVGIMLGTLASMGALVEVASQMGWVYVAIACKVSSPFLATIVALIKQSPTTLPPSSGNTQPPFPTEKTQ